VRSKEEKTVTLPSIPRTMSCLERGYVFNSSFVLTRRRSITTLSLPFLYTINARAPTRDGYPSRTFPSTPCSNRGSKTLSIAS